MSEREYPRLERACLIEVSKPRNGRPGFAWVQGWKVRYSETRESVPMRLSDARALLCDAREASK